MDLDRTLRELYEEKKRVDRAVTRLEARLAVLSGVASSRRGRKSMGAEERLEVSRRMRAYWAAWRVRGRSKRSSGPERAAN